MLSLAVKHVYPLVLVMQRLVQEPPADALAGEHASDKRLELDVTMVQLGRDGTAQLQLVGLEAGCQGTGLFGKEEQTTHLYRSIP